MHKQIKLDDIYSLSLLKSLKKHSLEDSHIVISAMKFAKYYHQGQERKSGEPYYMHPVAVAELVLPYNQKPEVIASALLHDVVEDTDASIEMVEAEFGSRVGEMVYRLTRIRGSVKLTLEKIIDDAYMANDRDALLIKLCDRLHNLSTIDIMSNKKIHSTIIESLKELLPIAILLEIPALEKELYFFVKKITDVAPKKEDDFYW